MICSPKNDDSHAGYRPGRPHTRPVEHDTRPVTFYLVWSMILESSKYVWKEHAGHLLSALKENYKVMTEDWKGSLCTILRHQLGLGLRQQLSLAEQLICQCQATYMSSPRPPCISSSTSHTSKTSTCAVPRTTAAVCN
jgi:hypothetical protein